MGRAGKRTFLIDKKHKVLSLSEKMSAALGEWYDKREEGTEVEGAEGVTMFMTAIKMPTHP